MVDTGDIHTRAAWAQIQPELDRFRAERDEARLFAVRVGDSLSVFLGDGPPVGIRGYPPTDWRETIERWRKELGG